MTAVSLDDEVKKILRISAEKPYCSKRGALSRVIEEAIKNLDYTIEHHNIRTIFKAYRMIKGIKEIIMGSETLAYFHLTLDYCRKVLSIKSCRK